MFEAEYSLDASLLLGYQAVFTNPISLTPHPKQSTIRISGFHAYKSDVSFLTPLLSTFLPPPVPPIPFPTRFPSDFFHTKTPPVFFPSHKKVKRGNLCAFSRFFFPRLFGFSFGAPLFKGSFLHFSPSDFLFFQRFSPPRTTLRPWDIGRFPSKPNPIPCVPPPPTPPFASCGNDIFAPDPPRFFFSLASSNTPPLFPFYPLFSLTVSLVGFPFF